MILKLGPKKIQIDDIQKNLLLFKHYAVQRGSILILTPEGRKKMEKTLTNDQK